MDKARLVEVEEEVRACRDPDDDKFLEHAFAGRADAIITGDNDLLTLKSFRGIPILTVSTFLEGW